MTMGRLSAGDAFSEFAVTTVGGQKLSIPADLRGEYAILLFYRAWW
jgi:peroxiredoxin